MEYRIKAAMKIIMELTREDAFKLNEIVDEFQKRTHIGERVLPFEKMSKEDALINIREILNSGTLDVPAHLKGHLERFLELMINERAPMDELVYEYGRAFCILLRFDLMKPDTQEESIEESDVSHPNETGSGGDAARPEKENERRKTLSDIADGIVTDLVSRGLTFPEARIVIEEAQGMFETGRRAYSGRVDTIPIKELKRMREEQDA